MKLHEVFQPVYDWFKNLDKTWIGDVLRVIGQIIGELLQEVGEEYFKQIEAKIIETKEKYPNATGDEKFAVVFDFVHALIPAWKESKIDLIIQSIFSKLKEDKKV